MIKLIFHDDNEALVKAAGAMSTLIESERHIKQASSSAMSEQLIRDNLPDKDHYAVHLIALGAGEYFSSNKNGDYWPEEMLKRCSHTFVTDGHMFREHRNHHPRLAIGSIKAAAYNDAMHRTELIIHGNKRKSEREYESIKKGGSRSYSMSARVSHDVCSCCGNKAKSSSVYCEHLKRNMNQYLPEFRKFAYAENPDGKFFDISDVENPADRIAHYLEYRFDYELKKAASAASGFFFSDQMAQEAGLVVPELGCSNEANQSWLEKLAKVEGEIEKELGSHNQSAFLKQAAQYAFEPDSISEEDFTSLRKMEPDVMFYGLAKRATCLPFVAFCAYVTGTDLKTAAQDETIKAATTLLPGMFRSLMAKPASQDVEKLFDVPYVKFASRLESEVLDRVGASESVLHCQSRILGNAALHGLSPVGSPKMAKRASIISGSSERAEQLVHTYGIYKSAFCAAHDRFASISANKLIDDQAAQLVIFQHLI